MTTATGNASKGKSKASKSKGRSKACMTRGQMCRAGAFATLAAAGLTVSLPHLASEVASLTGASQMAAWFTAVVIDLGLCASKAHLSAKGPKTGVAWSVVVACTLVSVCLNCHAFLANAETTFGMVAAIGFGIFIPLFVVAMSFLASETMLRHK